MAERLSVNLEMHDAGELDGEAERRAMAITRRILATLQRYMLGGADPERERVLERIEGSVRAIEQRLAAYEHAVG